MPVMWKMRTDQSSCESNQICECLFVGNYRHISKSIFKAVWRNKSLVYLEEVMTDMSFYYI